MVKAIVFDIGGTLVDYKMPLNWSALYRPAFESVAGQCGYSFSEEQLQHAGRVLAKYNTRINPREHEVASDRIFREIIGGMDNVYALEDISEVIKYIDYPFTSNDVGYRKPRREGLLLLSEKMGVPVTKMAFVGDEEKDILCAADAGAYSVLINRSGSAQNYGQDKEISSLDELPEMVG